MEQKDLDKNTKICESINIIKKINVRTNMEYSNNVMVKEKSILILVQKLKDKNIFKKPKTTKYVNGT